MKRLHLFAAMLFSAVSLTAYSQDEFANDPNIQHEIVTDQSLVRAIAPYDEGVRNDILTATQYPDILNKLSQIREQSSNGFRKVIGAYSQKKQGWFYEVSRYPELTHKLATLPRKTSKAQVEAMLPNASADLKKAAWKLYKNNQKGLVAVDNLHNGAQDAFQNAIASLDPEAQAAFERLEDVPDMLSLLNDHSDLTARLGERYKNNPAGVAQELADAHNQFDSQRKQELAAYQNELMQDPEAVKELSEASEEYASNAGYSYPAPTGEKVVNYGSPYSYWFGYPYWYGSPMWYPGYYGYGAGFYMRGGMPFVYALPSPGFSNWFFGGAYQYYPHLYRQYDRYYRGANVTRPRVSSPSRNAFVGAARRHFDGASDTRMGTNARSFRSADMFQNSRSMSGQTFRNNTYSAPAQRSYQSRTFNGGGGFSRGAISAGSSSRGGFSGGGASMRSGRR